MLIQGIQIKNSTSYKIQLLTPDANSISGPNSNSVSVIWNTKNWTYVINNKYYKWFKTNKSNPIYLQFIKLDPDDYIYAYADEGNLNQQWRLFSYTGFGKKKSENCIGTWN